MATVELRYDPKDSAWFTANATMVLKAGEPAYHSVTGKFKLGDGVTQLQNLTFLSNEAQLITATVVNKTGVNLLASNYQVVKVSTAQGQRLAVDFAQANNDNNSADTIGLVKENISVNQTGDITILGQLTEINTTGSLQGETWADGDVLYLSPITPGEITKVKPTGLTGHIVVLGYVEYAHAIHGKIYVKVMNGWELDELHNVYINPSTLANDDLLRYNSSTQLWNNSEEKTKIFKDLSIGSALTGTTAITLIKSILISANSIKVNDIVNIIVRSLRNTATGNASQYLYYNTSASLTGATLMATQTATMGYGALRRNLFVRASNDSETLDTTFNSSNDDATAPTSIVVSNLNIDWTSNVYIIQAYRNAANSDSTTSRGMVITRFR